MDAQDNPSTVVQLKRPRGRPGGRRYKNRVPHKPRPGARHDLVPLGDNSGPARFFRKMVRDIEADLGARRNLSRIQGELIRAFAGAATMLQYQNVQIALGEASEIDFTAYARLANTMLRVGSRLGLSRRAREIEPTLDAYLNARLEEQDAVDIEASANATNNFDPARSSGDETLD